MASVGPTKEELSSRIAELESQLARLTEDAAQRDAIARSGERGWVITTPNPEFSGRTYGVYFEGGKAFVPEETPRAQLLVNRLQVDMGYQVEFITDAKVARLTGPEPKLTPATEAALLPGQL
jgi:hypothetical protein